MPFPGHGASIMVNRHKKAGGRERGMSASPPLDARHLTISGEPPEDEAGTIKGADGATRTAILDVQPGYRPAQVTDRSLSESKPSPGGRPTGAESRHDLRRSYRRSHGLREHESAQAA